jgi:hypothetical protein
LWWVLCIASVWLINKSAMAVAWGASTMKLNYTWVNDADEVVYNVSFISEVDNSQDLLNIYKSGSNLYITPNNVVVNPEYAGTISRSNRVEWGVYWHVLWWNNNRVYSENVTVIAWEGNTVNSQNANVTILWWKQNVLNAGSGSRTAILVWWYKNGVYNSNEWVNIIWWTGNVISGSASNITILWWNDNTVEWVNAIVWWSKVTVPSGVNDVFVFSEMWWAGLNIDTSDSSGAFYLDVVHWLWINAVVNDTTNWVEAWWAVWFGEIDIDNNVCGW